MVLMLAVTTLGIAQELMNVDVVSSGGCAPVPICAGQKVLGGPEEVT